MEVMIHSISRRDFLKRSSVLTAGLATLGSGASLRAAKSPNEKVVIAIVGCNARGMAHIAGYLPLPNAEIGYICDVDSRAVEKGIATVARKQQRKPQGVKDFRRILDNPDVDAVSIATPDHWHAPATILACAAGKHVYVEKPGSHNLRESELMVAAARKYKRVVQMGNQRRSWPWVIESIGALHAGELGRVCFARGWYTNHRTSIIARQSATVNRPRCRSGSIIPCGRDPRRNGHSKTISSITTGIGSGTGGPANSATTASMRSISPAGACRWNFRGA